MISDENKKHGKEHFLDEHRLRHGALLICDARYNVEIGNSDSGEWGMGKWERYQISSIYYSYRQNVVHFIIRKLPQP